MAIPSRFLKPAAARPLKETAEKTAKVISPTAVAVLLSVMAHGLILAFGPRASFSFAALSEAAQQQDAAETIVPVVEISPADRSRLPSFAQPRRLSTPPTGLDGLALPPGLPNTAARIQALQQKPPSTTATSRPLPSATPSNQTGRRQFSSNFRTSALSPNTFRTRRSPSRNETRNASPTAVLPAANPSNNTIDFDGLSSSQSDIQLGNTSGLGTQNGSPQPPGTKPSGEQTPSQSSEDLLTGLIRNQASNSDSGTETEGSENLAINASPTPTPTEEGEASATDIDIESPVIDIASAQQDASRLRASFVYDERETSEEDAKENTEEWLSATGTEESKEVASETSTVEIDSNFKVCKDFPPNDGLIGVVINPDGSQTETTVLRSIGYDILNRQALSAVEYGEFEQPEQPTKYLVTIDVIYEPEGCVEDLPAVE